MNNVRQWRVATSLLLSILAALLLAALWTIDWLERHRIPWDLVIGVSYFVLYPGLSLLAVAFSVRDLFQKERRTQAAAALCISLALLGWFWVNRPH